jgi:hypothetical protein
MSKGFETLKTKILLVLQELKGHPVKCSTIAKCVELEDSMSYVLHALNCLEIEGKVMKQRLGVKRIYWSLKASQGEPKKGEKE